MINQLVERVASRAHARAVAGTAGANVAITLIGSLGGLFIARVLGPTGRGDLVIVLQWPAMIGTMAGVAVNQATCYWMSKRPSEARSIMWTAATAALLTGLIVAVAGPWMASAIGRNDQVVRSMTFIFALSPLYIAGGVWMSALQATTITGWNVARVTQPLFYLAGVTCLWGAGALTLTGAVGAFAGSLIVQALCSLMLARREVGHYRHPELRLLRPLYAYGAKVWFAIVPVLLNVSVDQLVLSVWPGVTAAALGNYVLGVSLSNLVLPVTQAFGTVAFPRIARAQGEADARQIERWSLVGAAAAATVIVAAVCALAPLLVPVVFGNGYRRSIVVLWLLAPGAVFLAINQVLAGILLGRGRPLFMSAAEGIGVVFTVVLLVVLIPRFGIRGAAVTSTVTYGAVMVLLFWGIHRARVSGSQREVS
jgi:O-antigen/teichoic acid export membrane protein